MMGMVALIIKLMPDDPKADLNAIRAAAESAMKAEGAQTISFEEKPIAFGLKAIFIKFQIAEDKGTDHIEDILAKLEHVNSVTVEDYRRTFG